jgi:hypothetical protein
MIRNFFDSFTWFWRAGRFMSGPSPSHELMHELEHDCITCQKKLKKDQQRTLWKRHVFTSQRPAMLIVSDPHDQAVGRDYSFQEEEQTMHTTEKEDCGIPSEVNGEEGENK